MSKSCKGIVFPRHRSAEGIVFPWDICVPIPPVLPGIRPTRPLVRSFPPRIIRGPRVSFVNEPFPTAPIGARFVTVVLWAPGGDTFASGNPTIGTNGGGGGELAIATRIPVGETKDWTYVLAPTGFPSVILDNGSPVITAMSGSFNGSGGRGGRILVGATRRLFPGGNGGTGGSFLTGGGGGAGGLGSTDGTSGNPGIGGLGGAVPPGTEGVSSFPPPHDGDGGNGATIPPGGSGGGSVIGGGAGGGTIAPTTRLWGLALLIVYWYTI